jgi:putative NADH-flavin reductase
MIITIFGATGITGVQLVKQALAKGYTVKAFGRNVDKLIDADLANDKLEAFKGYVFDEDDVLNAVKGSDAVLSTLGGAFNGEDKARSLGIKNIVKQMAKAGISRIVALGGQGVLNADEHTIIMDTPGFPAEYLPVSKEHLQAYLYLKESDLNWTFLCSPDIRDEEANGKYITNVNYPPPQSTHHVSTGNLAHFMLAGLENNSYIKQRVGICDA